MKTEPFFLILLLIMLNAIRNLIIVLFTAAAIAGCGSEKESDNRLTVSIEPQRYLLERIAGPKWTVTTLLDRGEDPESFDPSVAALRNLYDSRACFIVGTLGFEHGLLEGDRTDVRLFDTGRGIGLLHGTHSHCHHHHDHDHDHDHGDEADPHIWTSIDNSRAMARNMLEAMIELDPADSAVYRANYEKLVGRLDSCRAAVASLLDDSRGGAFMVWHPSLSYFAAENELEQIAIGLDNKEMSAGAFRNNIDLARDEGASVFLVQPDFDAGRSVAIADEAGVRSVMINTLAYDIPSELVRIAEIISSSASRQNYRK